MAVRQRGPRRDALANQEKILTAATAAYRRGGASTPMSQIAAKAGVGVGTLYRRYHSRDALVDALTQRSFEFVSRCARRAQEMGGPAMDGVHQFLETVIDARDELVLPLHGGPAHLGAGAAAARSEVHRWLAALIERGHRDGSIRTDATVSDIVVFGAMLAQPLPNSSDWPRTAARLKRVYLDGLGDRSR